VIDPITINIAQVEPENLSQDKILCAAHRQGQDHFAANRSLRRWTMLAPILVRKLNSASEPTARMGGTPSQKSGSGAAERRPRLPSFDEGPYSETNQALNQQIHDVPASAFASFRWRRALDRLRGCSDKAFPLKVQNNFLRRLFADNSPVLMTNVGRPPELRKDPKCP